MENIDVLLKRNSAFAETRAYEGLPIIPPEKIRLICCLDTRVDPSYVLGVRLGEAAVIRNVGGRVTPSILQTLTMLDRVGQANSGTPGIGWNLIVLHHTDCGMTDLAAYPDLLAEYFEVTEADLTSKAVSDPYASVHVDVDVDVLKSASYLPAAFLVSSLVYDVATGLVETVVAPSKLRS